MVSYGRENLLPFRVGGHPEVRGRGRREGHGTRGRTHLSSRVHQVCQRTAMAFGSVGAHRIPTVPSDIRRVPDRRPRNHPRVAVCTHGNPGIPTDPLWVSRIDDGPPGETETTFHCREGKRGGTGRVVTHFRRVSSGRLRSRSSLRSSLSLKLGRVLVSVPHIPLVDPPCLPRPLPDLESGVPVRSRR